jgi:small-conductance mechanosensitive channel
MSLTGHHVQLPNALVYKSVIRNYSSNPNRREDFTVGIGYDVSIPEAQSLALKVLDEHPAVLKLPEPWVLVDSLGAATVVLRVYFWLDGGRFSWLKVRSSVIRLTKRAFQDHGISMPDEAREVVFPRGITLRTSSDDASQDFASNSEAATGGASSSPSPESGRAGDAAEAVERSSVRAEGHLTADSERIKEQAAQARPLDAGENLLDSGR